ncbi:NAD(P)/FAD-dependent oxidoreductase [bacterium]
MKKIIIIGGGFAGIQAAKQISKLKNVECILFDNKEYTVMKPSLPDVIGGTIEDDFLVEKIVKLIPKKILFKKEKVGKIDLINKSIVTDTGNYKYDYLIIASGSRSNFYKFDQNLNKLYKLDFLEDALRIKNDFLDYISNTSKPTVVISGASFTGIELACALFSLSVSKKKHVKIILIERANLLGPLPLNIRDYMRNYIFSLGFILIEECEVISFDGKNIKLNNNQSFDNVFFCWCAGVKISISDIAGNHSGLPDGRIIVNEFLQIPERKEVFAVGDSAAIKNKDMYLRRAVNFSIYSGKIAGRNIFNIISNKKLKKFYPLDLGWIIPIYNSSIGKVLGITIKGRIGLRLHYFMCALRNYNLKNKFFYLKLMFNKTSAK